MYDSSKYLFLLILTWCVSKPTSNDTQLMENLEYVCRRVDCHVIERGGPCFHLETHLHHASVAMNLYYQSTGRRNSSCDFRNSGLISLTDPSKPNWPIPISQISFRHFIKHLVRIPEINHFCRSFQLHFFRVHGVWRSLERATKCCSRIWILLAAMWIAAPPLRGASATIRPP